MRTNFIRVLSGKELCVPNSWFKKEEGDILSQIN